MNKNPIVRYGTLVIAFAVLIVGYVYFNNESLENSGRANAELIAQSINDGDIVSVRAKLDDFVGISNPAFDAEYARALTALDYIETVVADGGQLVFVGGELTESSNENTIYGSVFAIPAPQGGSDYVLITETRVDNAWVLSNVQLAAVNPLGEGEN